MADQDRLNREKMVDMLLGVGTSAAFARVAAGEKPGDALKRLMSKMTPEQLATLAELTTDDLQQREDFVKAFLDT